MKIGNEKENICFQCGGRITRPPVSFIQDETIYLFCIWNCKAEFKDGKPRTIRKSPPRKQSARDLERLRRPSETAIKTTIQNNFDILGLFNLRLNSGAIKAEYTTKAGIKKTRTIHLCKPGTPDNFALPGVPLFVEVKKPGEIPDETQKAVHVQIKHNGGLVIVADDPDQVAAALKVLADNKPIIDSIKGSIRLLQSEIDQKIYESSKK